MDRAAPLVWPLRPTSRDFLSPGGPRSGECPKHQCTNIQSGPIAGGRSTSTPFGDWGSAKRVRICSHSGLGRSVQPVSLRDPESGRVSNSRPFPRSQCSSSEAIPTSPPFRRAHSQTTATRQPASSSSARFRRSRSTLASNFACQNSSRVAGVVVKRHPACLCQKQPCTKHTASKRRNTRSGVPGSFRLCSRNLRPRGVQGPPKDDLGLGVPASDPGHHPRSGSPVHNVRHRRS